MPKVGFGNQRQEFPVGKYLAQVVKNELVRVKDLKNPGKQVERLKFTVDVRTGEDQWETRTVFCSPNFTDEAQAEDPQFISGLNKLTRACGLKVPETVEEAEAFDTDDLNGLQFVWAVIQDEETHKIIRKFLRLKQAQPHAEPEAAPARRAAAPPATAPQAAAERAEQAPNYATATVRRPAPATAAAAPGRNSHARTIDHADPFA